MAINLLEAVQQHLGYPTLSKIDTTTNLVVPNEHTSNENSFSQAAIPAVLAGLNRHVQTLEGAEDILKQGPTNNWTKKIFKENSYAAIQAIATYSKQSAEETVSRMNSIATEAVRLVKENLPPDADEQSVKELLSTQISHILLYLPPTLQMGAYLNDNTLDDNTHKMEGPMSSLMNTIGEVFSSPVSSQETKRI